MRVRLLPGAKQDLQEAVESYQLDGPELVADFLSAVDATIESIAEDPSRFAIDPYAPPRWPARMTTIQRFPFKVVFEHWEELLTVVAISHFRRNPRHWRDRR